MRPAPPYAALAALASTAAVAAALAWVGTTGEPEGPWWVLVAIVLLVAVPGVVAGLVLRRFPRHRIGWLLAAQTLLVGVALLPAEVDGPASRVLRQLTLGTWVLLYLALVLVAYHFPDGHAAGPRWRRWVRVFLVGYLVFVVVGPFDAEAWREQGGEGRPPLPVLPGGLVDLLALPAFVLVVASLFGAVVSARQRLRRAEGEERLQLLWFSWAALSIPAAIVTCWVDYALTGSAGNLTVFGIAVFGSVIPVCLGIALLRTRLFDIELVLSRTVVYGVLTLLVVGVYAAALLLAGRVLGEGTAGLVGVAVVAVAVQPVHAWLRRRVERWVYGDRRDPGLALRRLSDRVESATDPASVLTSVTDSVRDALRVDRAWIERDEAPHGPDAVRVPLVHRGERLGDLAVQVPLGRALSTADLALLHDLARYAAVVVQAASLAADLQGSRARLVRTREEERRRLRRDLHDGLGPSLAAIVLKLGAAQRRLDDAERADLLGQTMTEVRAAIAEVRRLVDDLRPPAIDEVGLIGAIRQRAASLTQAGSLAVEVAGPAALPPLPAAVEVAAFRIAAEAMTNAVRHSGAHRCLVRIAVDGGFELTVSDDGRGAPLGTASGVGWTSMSERAEELGGTCTVSSRAGGGLVVRAVLPLAPTAERTGADA